MKTEASPPARAHFHPAFLLIILGLFVIAQFLSVRDQWTKIDINTFLDVILCSFLVVPVAAFLLLHAVGIVIPVGIHSPGGFIGFAIASIVALWIAYKLNRWLYGRFRAFGCRPLLCVILLNLEIGMLLAMTRLPLD